MKKRFITIISCVAVLLLLVPNVSFAYSNDWLDGDTELSAHRGAHVVAPENSVEAIKWAGLLDYGFVEIDIQETKDGYYVLMHDADIDRTTNGSGKIENLTLEEIKSYNMVTEDGTVTDIKVPTLEEALEAAAKYDVGVNFDGSKGDWEDKDFVDYVMELAEETGVLDKSFFVLSNKEIRDQFNEWYPEATVTFLGNASENVEEDIEELQKYKSSLYTTSIHNIDEKSAQKIHDAGMGIHLYQVNTAELYNEAIKYQPRLIETDVIIPGGAINLATSVEQLSKLNVIESSGNSLVLGTNLMLVSLYEKLDQGHKVIKHLENFKEIVNYMHEYDHLPDYVKDILIINADKIIYQW